MGCTNSGFFKNEEKEKKKNRGAYSDCRRIAIHFSLFFPSFSLWMCIGVCMHVQFFVYIFLDPPAVPQ